MAIRRASHADRVCTVLSHGDIGALATLEAGGHPYVSLVEFALDQGRPILLLSDLAEHTKNFKRDPRASLLVSAFGENPLAEQRVTLVGQVQPVEVDPSVYLKRHPRAERYLQLNDFRFYGLEVERVRYIGGFGRMSWMSAAEYREGVSDPVVAAEKGIVDHMHDDHADALETLFEHYQGGGEGPVTMAEVDRFGYLLRRGSVEVAVPFPSELDCADEVRKALIAQLKIARKENR